MAARRGVAARAVSGRSRSRGCAYRVNSAHAVQPVKNETMPTADCRLPIADCRLPIADCRLPIADCRLPTADCRLPTADRRLLADCQPPTADHQPLTAGPHDIASRRIIRRRTRRSSRRVRAR
ncbi:conserved domain protein [Burkholderia mallei ATCC 23344]|uniref:Conserved domain protein n=1 Tax=Burkholderia mallei (strain ATCC 23344) TaxID=243160 RepID=A0A0H2WGY7_BURMA|nr:conserved domain protein [Burkholderia mallei ATCC 23344]